MQKKFFAVAAFALAFAFAFSASAAYDFGSTTLKPGSKGAAVSQLQSALNACNAAGLNVDGIYGKNQTEPAVKAFQASKGLTSDGLVGVKTKAALNSCGSTTPTTPSTSALCPNGMTLASNCTMSPNSSSWGTSSAEGYTDTVAADYTNRVSTVYESESNKTVAGFQATARLADQKVERVQVEMSANTVVGGSKNISDYISALSLWNGSTKIATMRASDASYSASADSYTFNFTGLSAVIPQGQIGRFYVSVDANTSIDSAYTNTWTVKFVNNGFRTASPNGVYVSGFTPSGDVSVAGLTFAKFANSGIKAEVTTASTNPTSGVVTVSETANTDVTLLKFNIKAVGTDITLQKLPIALTLSNSGSAYIDDMVNTIGLVSSTGSLGSMSPVSGNNLTESYLFSSLGGYKIPAGTTAEFSVVANLKAQKVGNTAVYPGGSTLKADFSAFTGIDMRDSRNATMANPSGGASGENQTLLVNGVSVAVSSKSATVSNISNDLLGVKLDASFNSVLTSTGSVVHIPVAAANAITVNLRNASTGVSAASASTTLIKGDSDSVVTLGSLNARPAGNYYQISGPEAFIFGLSAKSTSATGTIAPGTYSVELANVKVYDSAGNLVTVPVTGELTNTVSLN